MEVRVRIGLHSGPCTRRGGNYFGSSVNRAARIEAIARGGQTIMSEATAELLTGSLPEGQHLRFLGAHRLKDLSEPEAGLPARMGWAAV
jgi:class 3 adenylate cyclase